MASVIAISTRIIPPGGWKFHESGYVFDAQTFEKLVQAVSEYRSSNGLPAGDPANEIMAQIGRKNPTFVLNRNSAPPSQITGKIKAFAVALKNYILSGGKLVDQNTANIRSSICVHCHNNVGDQIVPGCEPCSNLASAGIQFIRNTVLNGRKTPLDSKLKSCALCGCDIRMKIWFPVKYFDPTGSLSNKWPTFCWMKDNK